MANTVFVTKLKTKFGSCETIGSCYIYPSKDSCLIDSNTELKSDSIQSSSFITKRREEKKKLRKKLRKPRYKERIHEVLLTMH
jgi:ribosomal protein S24E